ncbi:hypothetical protein MKY09_16300 [Psychrobacillus sp. FSL K6-4046]
MMNPTMSTIQFKQLVDTYHFDLYIYDEEARSLLKDLQLLLTPLGN